MTDIETMSISDYLAVRHYNEKETILKEINQKIIDGELHTEKDINHEFMQDLRNNNAEPKIGEISILIRYTEKMPTMMGQTEIPLIEMSLIRIMITE